MKTRNLTSPNPWQGTVPVPHRMGAVLPLPKLVHDSTQGAVHSWVSGHLARDDRFDNLEVSHTSVWVPLHERKKTIKMNLLHGCTWLAIQTWSHIHWSKQFQSFRLDPTSKSSGPSSSNFLVKLFQGPSQGFLIPGPEPPEVVCRSSQSLDKAVHPLCCEHSVVEEACSIHAPNKIAHLLQELLLVAQREALLARGIPIIVLVYLSTRVGLKCNYPANTRILWALWIGNIISDPYSQINLPAS